VRVYFEGAKVRREESARRMVHIAAQKLRGESPRNTREGQEELRRIKGWKRHHGEVQELSKRKGSCTPGVAGDVIIKSVS